MDIETKLQLFDSIVTPILLYGSEVWGFENISNVEKIQIRFYNLLLGLNGSVSNVVTFGELGKFPLRVLCKERILKYWLRLISNKEGLRYEMYMCQKYDCENKLISLLYFVYLCTIVFMYYLLWSCVSSFGKGPIGLNALIKYYYYMRS